MRHHTLPIIRRQGRHVHVCLLTALLWWWWLVVSLPTVTTSSSSPTRTTDLYKRLGLTNPKCSTKEIQKAYRKKALKHHPDKVSEHQRDMAEKEFKKIGEAYEILSNPEKRKLYDTYGDVALQPHFDPSFATSATDMGQGRNRSGPSYPFGSSSSSQTFFFGEENPFFDIMSSRKSSSSSPFSQPNREFFPFDLQDIILQSLRGQHPHTNTQTFGRSSSSSSFQSTRSFSEPSSSSYERYFYCSYEELCNPNGCKKKLKITVPQQQDVDPWTGRRGGGDTPQTKSTIYTIDVKPGWKEGTKVTFPPNHQEGIPSIIFILKEKPHEHFRRKNNDLIYQVTIQESQAQRGNFHLYIPPLPDDIQKKKIDIYISKEDESLPITNESSYKLTGRGMYYKGGTKRGDFIIQFRVIPSSTSSSSSSSTKKEDEKKQQQKKQQTEKTI